MSVVLLLLSACHRKAPPLPPDYSQLDSQQLLDKHFFSDEELAMQCAEIDRAMAGLRRDERTYEQTIAGNRVKNQVATAVASSVFWPAIFLAERNASEKTSLNALQQQKDTLYLLQRVKAC